MDNRQTYKAFCEREKTIPLFLSYGWLNAVAPENWNAVIEERGGDVIAALPYAIINKAGFRLIELPALTSYGGIWLSYPDGQKYASRLSYEKEVISALIEKLPAFDSFIQKFYPAFSNWLPFFWKGYSQSTYYTYLIENTENTDLIFSEFKENIRREIRKAEKTIHVAASEKIEDLFNLKAKSYDSLDKKLSISPDYLKRIYNFCIQNNCGELLIAKDKKGTHHAAAFFVWDKNTSYYLYGASDPEFKNSGAMSLLMWEGIQRSMKRSTAFNFEGSMIEEVERFFRSFGAKQVPYFVIKKVNSKLLRLKAFLSEF